LFSATYQTHGITAGHVQGRLVAAKWQELDTPQQRISQGDRRVLLIATAHRHPMSGWTFHRSDGDDWSGIEEDETVDVTLVSDPDLDEPHRFRVQLSINGTSTMQRLPARSGQAVTESQRLSDMRRILREAAADVREMPTGLNDARAAWGMAVAVFDHVGTLLDRAFLVPPTNDYRTFISAEREKLGDSPDIRRAAADFLVRLSGQLREDNLDYGFLMPRSWALFRDSDPKENWPANAR
jgi:hypothetical protein